MTHYLNIEIIELKVHFKVTYRNKRFKKVEHLRGKLKTDLLKTFGRVIPLHFDDIGKFNKEFEGRVIYTVDVKEKSLYTKFVDEWHSFYEEFAKIPPKFTAADGKSLKGIITYLQKISKDDSETLLLWKLILDNWNSLPKFYQDNADLKIINSKLNIIINAIKQKNNTDVSGTNYSVEL